MFSISENPFSPTLLGNTCMTGSFVCDGRTFNNRIQDIESKNKILFAFSHKICKYGGYEKVVNFERNEGFLPSSLEDQIIFDEGDKAIRFYNLKDFYHCMLKLKSCEDLQIAFVKIPDDSLVFTGNREAGSENNDIYRMVTNRVEYFNVKNLKEIFAIDKWLEQSSEKLQISQENIQEIKEAFKMFGEPFMQKYFV